jgi:hypothetical protein
MDYQPFWWERCHLILSQADKPSDIAWWVIPSLSALLAVIGAVAGSWMTIAFDRKKAVNQELVKKRLELYTAYVPLANDLYCFLMKVGNFRSMTPNGVLDNKRKLDQFIHLYGPLFSGSGLVDTYNIYIALCFKTFRGHGVSAKIRADSAKLARQYGSGWQASWDDSFDTTAVAPDIEKVHAAYKAFVKEFALQVGAQG